MKCVICKQGETQVGTATVILERNGATIVIRHVPADVCTNCGEEYVDEETTAQLLAAAEQAAGEGVQVHVREYIAA